MFDAHVLKVLVASPGDTAPERDAVERALHGWNSSRAEREQIMLAPWRWETHAVPELGGSAQSIINSQAVDSCDVVLAIFDSKLGTATEAAVSGTAEEIQRAHSAKKPVHVWFSTEPLPREIQPQEIERLNAFKEKMRTAGLLGEYGSPDDLQHEVRKAIEYDLNKMDLGRVTVRSGNGAQARKVVSSVLPVTALGSGMWRVRVSNGSGAPVTAVEVAVTATVSGAEVEVVPAKSRIDLGSVIGKMIGPTVGGMFGPSLGPEYGTLIGGQMSGMAQQELKGQLNDYMADGFETALAAQGSAVVMYASESGAKLSVSVTFDDENGIRWTRVDNSEPVQVRT